MICIHHRSRLVRLIGLLCLALGSASNAIQLRCESKGHVDHYYHFFFNCLVPVIVFHHHHPNKSLQLCDSPIGDMKKIFEAVVPKLTYADQCSTDKNQEAITLPGYDGDFGAGVIRLSSLDRKMVVNQFRDTMPKADRTNFSAAEILLIGRAPPSSSPVSFVICCNVTLFVADDDVFAATQETVEGSGRVESRSGPRKKGR
jgi:hypothetical protein